MDFDSFGKLIPLFFLILWSILVTIAKKKKKTKQTEGKQKAPKPFFKGPLVGKLQDTLNKLFEELESKPDGDLPDTLKSFKEKPKELKKGEIRKPVAAQAAPSESTPPEEIRPEKKVHPMFQKAPPKATIPRTRLQQAVIWSEILSQPVGLRDK